MKLLRRHLGLWIACAVIPGLLLAAAKDESRDLRKWWEGPIRYIALKSEIQSFRALDRDEDRVLFIERFWSRRDPTPETLTNEYRQIFWERVQQANSNFLDSTKSGWKTDRGKIHVLYGPPSDIEDLTNLDVGLPTGGRGVIRWIYQGRPAQRGDLNPVVVVPFVRDGGGEYRVSYDPELSSIFFDSLNFSERSFGDKMIDRFLNKGFLGRSELSVMLDLGKLQEVPPQEQVLITRVETLESYRSRPISVRTDRYLHPDQDGTLLILTVDLSGDVEGDPPAILARVEPREESRETRLLGEGSFRIEKRDGVRLAQGRLLLEPGEYTLTVIVADPTQVSTGMYRDALRIPQATERMRYSDLVWASELENLPYAALASYDEPFLVGPFRVLPRFDDVFRAGDTLKLFYEVYGARLPMQVTYRVEGQELDGSWVALGRPQSAPQSSSSQGWELATSPRWPVGEYRVHVEILDEQGRLISTQKPFRLEPVDPS